MLGSPAESLRLQLCHGFCNPASCHYLHSESSAPVTGNGYLHFSSRISLPKQQCFSTSLHSTPVFPTPRNKSPAKSLCILQRSPVFPSGFRSVLPPSLNSLAARVFQSFLLPQATQLPETSSCLPCCLAPPATLKAVLPILSNIITTIQKLLQ